MRTITYGTEKQTLLVEKLDRRDRANRIEPSLISDAIKALGLKFRDNGDYTYTYSVADTSRLLDYLLR